jgi:pimeloyl-ACP methyl ester carboxylesterase
MVAAASSLTRTSISADKPRLLDGAGVRLAVQDAGRGVPIVLLHGLTATRRYVVMGSRALERAGFRVVSYDARGHGSSSPAPEPRAYRYEDLGHDLEALLDALAIDRAILAGASMGAHTLARFARTHPERVAGLAIITPAFDPEEDRENRFDRWDRLANGLREGGVEGFVSAYDLNSVPEKWRDTLNRVLHQRLSAHDHPQALADALEQVPRSRPFERWEDLNAIDAPATIIASRDEADPEHPFAIAERYAREIPGATLVTEDPGHSPLAWQGAQVSRVISAVPAVR